MRIHDKAFYTALFFLIGIAAASLDISVWITILLVIIAASILFSTHKRIIVFFTFIAFFGFFYFNFYAVTHRANINLNVDTSFVGTVFREPKYGLKSQQLEVKLMRPGIGEVRIYTDQLPKFHYGDVVNVAGVVRKSPTGRLNISSFPKITVSRQDTGSSLKKELFKVKQSLTVNLKKALPPRQAALMSGLLFGERAEFSDDFEEALRKSGTTHIVALSGYNVAIIGIMLSNFLAYFFQRRKAFYISLLAIPIFVIMTGAEASVVRAGVMGIIALLAERQSRLYSFRNAITITALIMILINPRLLIFDLGFQLSFTALLGIVYLYPFFKRLFKLSDEDGIFGWRRNFFQTLSAQIAVAPILLGSFGYLSPTALIANVFILEFIPITMLLGFLTALLGFLPFGVSLLMGLPTTFLLNYEIFIIKFFSLTWL